MRLSVSRCELWLAMTIAGPFFGRFSRRRTERPMTADRNGLTIAANRTASAMRSGLHRSGSVEVADDVEADRGRQREAVHPVEDAAMSAQGHAGVLQSE